MKKTFLFGMIALLSVSLVFMGCPDDGEDAKSDAKAISTVLTVAPVAVTGAPAAGKDGTTAEKAKPYTVTLPVGSKGKVAVTNIAVSANATRALYSEATFTTEAPAAGIDLAAAGTAKDVYVKVTAQDSSVAYYKVSITISLQPQIATVLDVVPVAVTGTPAEGKDGTTAEKAKPYTVSLEPGTTGSVKASDIVSAGATVALYSDDGFATAAAGAGIALAAAGTAKDVYVKVTANEIVAYYKVSITIALSPDAGLTSVLGETISSFGGEAGTTTDAPKTATITLTADTTNKSAIGSGTGVNIAAASGATVALYTGGFTNLATNNTVSLPAGATTPVYIKVTAEDGTPLHYKVSIEYPKDLSGTVKKSTVANTTTDGLTVASATKLGDVVSIKLSGTGINGNNTLPSALETDVFPHVSTSTATGYDRVAAITLAGILATDDANFTIQQTNPALGLYVTTVIGTYPTNAVQYTDAKTQTEIETIFATDAGVAQIHFWKTANPVTYNKLKKYATVNDAQDDTSGGFAVLLIPTTPATDQKITIVKKLSGTTSTFVIDYSAVTFAAAL